MTTMTCEKCGSSLPPNARFCSYCGRPVAHHPAEGGSLADRLARVLGMDYTVVGELGRGGFAVVFSVQDQRLNRYLAVKVMRPELFPAPTARERFRREAQFVAHLHHPNILPVVFAGEGAGLAYFAMPRIEGETLERRLAREHQLAIPEAQRIFAELAAGLAYAHEQDVVHRDVKPANILLERDGKALLLDFGIAKGLSMHANTLSLTGVVVGSPAYMSPEQATARRTITPRSDTYSLGVIAFEMLTGTLPFTGATPHEIAHKKSTSVAPDVRHFRAEIPATVAEAVARCLERDPVRRWHAVTDAARAMAAV